MADGASDDEVIHLASFNVHRSQGRRSACKRELITISDDSDEEPVTLVPSSPVLVLDEPDDDVSILKTIRRQQREVIRPAATWSSSSGDPVRVVGHTSGDAPSTPSTSRDVLHSSSSSGGAAAASRRPARTEAPSTTPGSSPPHPQPKPHASRPGTSSAQNPQSKGHAAAQPGTSTQAEPQASTSSAYGRPATGTQDKPTTHTQDNPLAGTSSSTAHPILARPRFHAHTQTLPPQASTSAQADEVSNTRPQDPTHAPTGHLILNQQPGAQAPLKGRPTGRAVLIAAAPERLGPPEAGHRITLGSQAPGEGKRAAQPQADATNQVRVRVLSHPPAPNPNARVPNPNANPHANPPAPPALTRFFNSPSLDPAGAPALAPNPNARVPNPNPPAPPALPRYFDDIVLDPTLAAAPAPAPPNPEGANPPPPDPPDPPALALAPAVFPRPEDARPGPSAPREALGAERQEEQPAYVRTLIARVVDLFPDVQEDYVADLILENHVKDLNVICNVLLEKEAYPRRGIAAAASATPTSILLEAGDTNTQVTEDLFDYSQLKAVEPEGVMQAADLLMSDFRMLSCQDIKWGLNHLKGHYAITRKALCEALKKWQQSGKRRRSRVSSERCYVNFLFEQGSVKFSRKMFFLENDRRYFKTYGSLEASVQKEVTFYKQKAKEWAEHEDFLLALQVNEDEYKMDGQLIECGCCYGEFAFEKMTQCSDGHLFCKECLVKYAQEAVFGSGQSELSCMEGGCPCSYPVCELEKVLPENILCKYYERQAEEAVAATCGDELVRCPFCNFPALLDKGMSLFSCPNPRCRKESCRKCHVQWKEHTGKTCEQVLERDEIRMRVLFEERMTAARVRQCVKCGLGLVKSEGCNRMSCRCGGFMCYLCREAITGYNHFCQHARSPGAPCRQCRKCSLWSDPTQDDERIIHEIQKEGEAELSKKSTESSGKRVGPPPEPSALTKRPRVGPLPPNHRPGPPPAPLPVRAPLLVPPRIVYPQAAPPGQAPPPGQVYQMFPPLAPYVPPLQHFPPLNNNNLLHHPPPPVNHNLNVMDLPMHYGPPHRHLRR